MVLESLGQSFKIIIHSFIFFSSKMAFSFDFIVKEYVLERDLTSL